jgi:hypothetical protein
MASSGPGSGPPAPQGGRPAGAQADPVTPDRPGRRRDAAAAALAAASWHSESVDGAGTATVTSQLEAYSNCRLQTYRVPGPAVQRRAHEVLVSIKERKMSAHHPMEASGALVWTSNLQDSRQAISVHSTKPTMMPRDLLLWPERVHSMGTESASNQQQSDHHTRSPDMWNFYEVQALCIFDRFKPN